MNAFLFDFPLNCNVIGGTNSGKSTWIQKVMDTPEVWARKPDRIYYFYGIESQALKQIKEKHPDAFFHLGMPSSFEGLFDPKLNNLVVIDDLAQQLENSAEFTDFLVVKQHCCMYLHLYNNQNLARHPSLECGPVYSVPFLVCRC